MGNAVSIPNLIDETEPSGYRPVDPALHPEENRSLWHSSRTRALVEEARTHVLDNIDDPEVEPVALGRQVLDGFELMNRIKRSYYCEKEGDFFVMQFHPVWEEHSVQVTIDLQDLDYEEGYIPS